LAEVNRSLKRLEGLSCWYAATGGGGSSFSLAFGKRVKRDKPLKNHALPKYYRTHEGEFALLVWCSWRLSRDGKVAATSDDCHNDESLVAALLKLRGARVERVRFDRDFGDLRFDFSSGRRLDVFCDHGELEPSFDANWELFAPGERLAGA
jgi:hypothetical protein